MKYSNKKTKFKYRRNRKFDNNIDLGLVAILSQKFEFLSQSKMKINKSPANYTANYSNRKQKSLVPKAHLDTIILVHQLVQTKLY